MQTGIKAIIHSKDFRHNYLFYLSENYSFSILRPLQDAIRNSGGKVAWFFEGNNINRSYINDNEEEIKTVEAVINYKPRAIFAPGNEIPHFFPGVKARLFHGFASEKLKRNKTRYSTVVRPWFDLYCTLGPDLTEAYSKSAEELGFFKVIETGWSKVDPLFLNDNKKKNDKPTILVASTFTPRYTLAPHLKDEIEKLSKLDDWNWLVTFHPKMDKELVKSYKAIQHQNLTFIETDDVIPLLQKADVLVCDSSSIKSEFLIQNKPVVAFRVEPTQAHLLHIEQPNELKTGIINALNPTTVHLDNIKAYANSIHPYFDGRSSYRVLEAVENYLVDPNKPLRKKPLSIGRRLKIRKQLNYWKFQT